MVQLSKRLLAVAELVSRGSVVADVGCDHAYTAIYLCEQGIAPHVIAMDVRKGPLARAQENVLRYGRAAQIELRLSDGVAALRPQEADTLLLAGMGGVLMQRILSEHPEITAAAKELVLQPQSEIAKVRSFLHNKGFRITKERMVREDGKFYVVLKAERTEQPERYESAVEYAYGRLLLEAGDEVLAAYLEREERLFTGVLSELAQQKTAKAEARKQGLKQRLSVIHEAQKRIQKEGNNMEQITVTIQGEKRQYPQGTTFLEISREYRQQTSYPIILASVGGRLRELPKRPEDGDEITFLATDSDVGNKTYIRGTILMLLKAFYSVLGHDKDIQIRMEHSIGNGLYGELHGGEAITKELLLQVKQEMQRLVKEDLPFEKRTVNTAEAMKLFHQHGMYDKEKLFGYRRVSKANIYRLGGFEDYFYGFMPPSTGMLQVFDLFPYEEGFILLVPDKSAPDRLPVFERREKFFHVLQESNAWGQIMGISTVGAMNDAITKGELGEIILVQEAFMEKKIAELAEQIRERKNTKFVMIAGPSSSGKTTFSHRLSIQLKTLGMHPHPIGIDDYFRNREDTPKHPDGSYNFECLEAIDIAQFNQDMTALLRGETVELPSFNFKKGVREYKGDRLTLGAEDILVIEGIHGLNDRLSESLPVESKFKIYISALTQLNIDEHNRIPTTDARLLRRIVRDARTRGASASDTIRMWPSVRKGEEENIFPFQEGADVMFNSALIYELVILKQFAEPLLFGVDRESPEYVEAKRLLKFLDYFLGASSEEVPKNSVLREFIGGSCFRV